MRRPSPTHDCRARAQRGVGRIEIDKVTFRYRDDQPPLFENFSLAIDPGACVALTGPSGCGKSTLARLLLGFHLPAAGAVRIDGRDTRHSRQRAAPVIFGMVPQETRLFSGTLSTTWCAPAAREPRGSDRGLPRAEIHDFIEAAAGLPEPVGENGVGLSGGQKQRIAIARALLRPRILIFDEATASLDRETAEAFARTVSRLRGSATVLFIAHQLPKGLQVDSVVTLGPSATRMSVVGEERKDA